MNNNKSKVLFFLPSQGIGGSNIFLSKSIAELTEIGHEVIVVGKKNDVGGKAIMKNVGVDIFEENKYLMALNIAGFDIYNSWKVSIKKVFTDLIKFFYGSYRAVKMIVKHKPDTVVVGDFPLMQIINVSKIFKKKTVCYCLTSRTKNSLKYYFANRTLNRADRIVANIDVLFDEWNIKNREEKCIRIPVKVGQNIKYNHEEYLEFREKILTNKYHIIYIAAMSDIKGHKEFIHVAHELIKERDDVEFLWVGAYNKEFSFKYSSGNSDSQYNATKYVSDYIKKYDISEDRLKILGYVPYALDLLRDSDILFSMNNYPHHQGPMLEAMSNSVAVIVNQDPFSEYYFKHLSFGYMAQKGDTNDWVCKCKLLLDDEQKRLLYAQNGYKVYHDVIEILSMKVQNEKIYS